MSREHAYGVKLVKKLHNRVNIWLYFSTSQVLKVKYTKRAYNCVLRKLRFFEEQTIHKTDVNISFEELWFYSHGKNHLEDYLKFTCIDF